MTNLSPIGAQTESNLSKIRVKSEPRFSYFSRFPPPPPPPQPRPARRELVDQHDHLLLAQPHLQGALGQDGRVSENEWRFVH